VADSEGRLVKALPSGAAWPLDSGLAPQFRRGGVATLPAALRLSAAKHGAAPCMATRRLCQRRRDASQGKTLEKLSLGDYTWKTYGEVQRSADALSGALHRMGFRAGDRVAIFSETRAEWFIAAMGALAQRLSVATIYSTLADSGVVHALNETEVQLVFVSFELMDRFIGIVELCPRIRTVIVFEDQLDGIGDVSSLPSSITALPYAQVVDAKNISAETSSIVPDPEDVAIIMYTSGSTGTPKGVELTHTNILSSVIAYSVQMNVTSEDRYLAFLPLAHIMELATEIALLSLGVTIFYSSPHTLTKSSPKVAPGSEGDAKLAKPTVMNFVPLILDRIIKKVFEKVSEQGRIKSFIFQSIVAYKPFNSPMIDKVVFQKVRDELGGLLTKIAIGGAPLSPQIHKTFRAIFGCTVQVGYAATETSSCATGMNEDDTTTGHCGSPCLNVFMRLTDWEEGKYMVTDKPRPRGEVLVGGPCIAKGYFKLPNLTNENFFVENGTRWFRTGDIGELNENGCLKIIDRKKDLVKLKHGEYVALGNAETILKTCSVVDNICIFADSTKENVVAVVVPVLSMLRNLAMSVGLPESSAEAEEQVCKNEDVVVAVLSQLQKHGKKCGLSRWEIPAAVYLTNELWTPDTGMVTAALKLCRKKIEAQYKVIVNEMYSRL